MTVIDEEIDSYISYMKEKMYPDKEVEPFEKVDRPQIERNLIFQQGIELLKEKLGITPVEMIGIFEVMKINSINNSRERAEKIMKLKGK